MFYSVPDADFFVAIQDGLTGTVVTILPLEYQANLAWKVSDEDCAKAREILLSALKEETTQKIISAATLLVSGHFIDSEGNQKTKVILKTASASYQNDIKAFLSDDLLFSKLNDLAESKGINARLMFGISIRLGNHGAPILIDLRDFQSRNIADNCGAPKAARLLP